MSSGDRHINVLGCPSTNAAAIVTAVAEQGIVELTAGLRAQRAAANGPADALAAKWTGDRG